MNPQEDPTRYPAGSSTGTPLTIEPTKLVVVSDEALTPSSGFKDETISYSATVKDDEEGALPATFVVDLEVNGNKVITGQVLDAAVYDPVTFALSLDFVVPDLEGPVNVSLVWAQQDI